MLDPRPTRVTFTFADHELEGRVVDATIRAAFNQPPERIFTVETDDSRYTVPARQATPV